MMRELFISGSGFKQPRGDQIRGAGEPSFSSSCIQSRTVKVTEPSEPGELEYRTYRTFRTWRTRIQDTEPSGPSEPRKLGYNYRIQNLQDLEN